MNPSIMESTETTQTKPHAFIRLLMENERRLHGYIYTLVGNHADSEDILQETSIVLWDKFSEFDLRNGNFIAWSFKVAFFIAQNHRRKKSRSRIQFSDSVASLVSDKVESLSSQIDRRHDLLADCIGKLSTSDQKLLQLRYSEGSSVEEAAEQAGRTKQAIYKALSRMRAALSECVSRQMRLEGQA